MTINLEKNQSISLAKTDGTKLTKAFFGLGWDAAPKKAGLFGGGGSTTIDLDASAFLLDANKNVIDIVWFNQKKSKDGSLKHSGDNLTGAGDGDDETILVELDKVPASVQTIVLAVASYQGQTFDKVANVVARVVDTSAGHENEIVRFNLTDTGTKTASIIAKLTRTGDGWAFTALGVPADGKTALKLVGAVQAAV